MDSNRFLPRFWRKLLIAPAVLLPVMLGAGALAVGWLAGGPGGVWGTAGVAGLVAGAAAAAWRVVWKRDRIRQQTFAELQAEDRAVQVDALRRLEWQLRRDDDRRTDVLIDQLQDLHERMTKAGIFDLQLEDGRGAKRLVQEVTDDTQRLFLSCLASLERTLKLHALSQELATEQARDEVVGYREALIREIGESVQHLGSTLDQLATVSVRNEDQARLLAATRDELAQGLEVARRVEERMAELDSSLHREGLTAD